MKSIKVPDKTKIAALEQDVSNWKMRWELVSKDAKMWSAECREAMRKYMDCEKELKGVRANMASLRDDCPNHRSSFDVWAIVAYMLSMTCLCAVLVWGYHVTILEKEPVIRYYPAYITKNNEGVWYDRCRKAWKILQYHHGGPNNSRAFAALNGDDGR